VQKNNQQFTFKESAPGNYDQGVNVDTEISFEFSNTLSRKEGVNTIEASPSTILTKEIRDNTVIFKPNKHLKENTQYTFKLSNISSIDNNTANPIILIFNTGKDNTVQAQFNRTLPYQGDGFYIDFGNRNKSGCNTNNCAFFRAKVLLRVNLLDSNTNSFYLIVT
jgi:hypothetical protein